MTTDKPLLPTQALIERLRASAHRTSEAHRMMAEAKSLRQADNPEGDKNRYGWIKPEQTLEWEAADELARLSTASSGELREAVWSFDLDDAPEGPELLVYRLDESSALPWGYGVRAIAIKEDGEWYGDDGDPINRPVCWTTLTDKPLPEGTEHIPALLSPPVEQGGSDLRGHRFGSPPEPVVNPSAEWCDRYADWYYQGKG